MNIPSRLALTGRLPAPAPGSWTGSPGDTEGARLLQNCSATVHAGIAKVRPDGRASCPAPDKRSGKTMKSTPFKKFLLAAVAIGSVIAPAIAGAQDYGRRGGDDSSREERRAERQKGERPRGERPQGERPQGDRPQRPQGPQGDRPSAGERGGRPDRPAYDRGDRPVRPDRPNPGERGGRPDRPDRPGPDGRDRPIRPDRPARPGVDRPGQPDRANPVRDNRGPRAERRNQYRDQVRRNWNRDSWRRNWNSRHHRNWWRNHRWFRGWNGVRIGFYFAPGYGYYSVPRSYWRRNYYEGQYLPSIFWRYRVIDPYYYGLPPAPPGCAWVYVDNNILLVDLYDGYIIEVISQAWYW